MPLKRLGTSCLTPSTANNKGVVLVTFFSFTFLPLGKGRNTAIFGPTDFFAAWFNTVLQKKYTNDSSSKTAKKSKKTSKIRSDTGKGSYKHNRPDLWDRGCIFFVTVVHIARNLYTYAVLGITSAPSAPVADWPYFGFRSSSKPTKTRVV